jgi:tellurite resistance protein
MDQAQNQDGIELAYAALAVFADDGTVDMDELNSLLGLAMRDGELSESEKAVLRNVFNRVLEEDVDGNVWERIQGIRRMHGV